MAYSDYGGYAYRNGILTPTHCDAVIRPDGTIEGSPGRYPGFAMLAAGVPHAEVLCRQSWPAAHVILGDGPVYLALHKVEASIYVGQERVADIPHDHASWADQDPEEWHVYTYDRYDMLVVYTQEANFYVYARLAQPDRVVWHGFAGYGVGMGLEHRPEYSTPARIAHLARLWPGELQHLG